MTKKTIRRTISIISTGFLILFLFTGSYHSFCECYAKTCPIHSHANVYKSFLAFLQPRIVDDIDQLPVASTLPLLEDRLLYFTVKFSPLKPRPPPHAVFPQITITACIDEQMMQ
jgi:hypothetical protein